MSYTQLYTKLCSARYNLHLHGVKDKQTDDYYELLETDPSPNLFPLRAFF